MPTAPSESHLRKKKSAPSTQTPAPPTPSSGPKRVIGKWILSKTLGQGSMGKVKLAMHSESKQKVGGS